MEINDNLLSKSEIISFKLRKLFDTQGFKRYNMTKFEEYKLYAGHMDFLVSDNVITFTDTNGKLMALKPDITLSIVKNFKARPSDSLKLYYNENVYRVSKGTGNFKEITQVGVEFLGDEEKVSANEVLSLAKTSLNLISESNVITCSYLGILSKAIAKSNCKEDVLNIIKSKSIYLLNKDDPVSKLISIYGKFNDVKESLKALCKEIDAEEEFVKFENEIGDVDVVVDFSLVLDTNYYNGMVFSGFVENIPESVLSGGRYDKLLDKLGLKKCAVGFALYLDRLERVEEASL